MTRENISCSFLLRDDTRHGLQPGDTIVHEIADSVLRFYDREGAQLYWAAANETHRKPVMDQVITPNLRLAIECLSGMAVSCCHTQTHSSYTLHAPTASFGQTHTLVTCEGRPKRLIEGSLCMFSENSLRLALEEPLLFRSPDETQGQIHLEGSHANLLMSLLTGMNLRFVSKTRNLQTWNLIKKPKPRRSLISSMSSE